MSNPVMLSDLRGVTVRNTFLELEESGHDEGDLPECGTGALFGRRFSRQASEPVKMLNRQVSEQTTAASMVTIEASVDRSRGDSPNFDNAMDPDEGLGQYVYKNEMLAQAGGLHCPAVPQLWPNWQHNPAASEQMVGIADLWKSGIPQCGQSLQAQRPPGQLESMPRFCPNCGAESEAEHRFCPYCCFQLQAMPSPPMTSTPTAPPQNGPTVATGASTSELLSSLRRFRYIQACPSDIERAHLLCAGRVS
mmetsp:Transcript_49308/g.107333  ORF Transcript_49308/g.107333 Transcript_49308/m.107333 type:complete len:250 (-) Transcript_49308:559-1308(-)